MRTATTISALALFFSSFCAGARAQTAELPLFRYYPSLKKSIPWMRIQNDYTPLQPLRALEKKLFEEVGAPVPSDPQLWVKRDDAPTEFLGGNKARKLEFLVADAKNKGAKVLSSSGMWGSNHALAVSLAAATYGFKSELILGPQPVTHDVQQKLLADHALGAKMIYCSNKISMGIELVKQAISSWFSSDTYVIPPGGSGNLGDLGYVNAFLELYEQAGLSGMPQEIFVPVGTMGTAAGLLVGSCLAGTFDKVKIIGVEVAPPPLTDEIATRFQAVKVYHFIRDHLSDEDRSYLPRCDFMHSTSALEYLEDYLDPGYGAAKPPVHEAIRLVKSLENLELEATYSGKAMTAMLDRWRTVLRQGRTPKKTLFWLTYRAHNLDEIINGAHWSNPAEKYKDLPADFHPLFRTNTN